MSQLFFQSDFETTFWDDFRFFIGLHQPSDAKHFDRCFVSINRIRDRISGFGATDWIMDSGAFTELKDYFEFRHSPETYAGEIASWGWRGGNLIAAVTQDYMCEAFILKRTGLTVAEHQKRSLQRFLAIRNELSRLNCGTYLMPVLQGYQPKEYEKHLKDYAKLLDHGSWVGVGSVCKRNGKPDKVFEVLDRIKQCRPDLRLHGFGLKITCLEHKRIFGLLTSADSQAWSRAARWEGRNQNSWIEAKSYEKRVDEIILSHSC